MTIDEFVGRSYIDWFGSGNTKEDVDDVVKEHGRPTEVYTEKQGYMVALVYHDKIVVTGYDGNEYRQLFVLTAEKEATDVHD